MSSGKSSLKGAPEEAHAPSFDLTRFMPYRLAVLADDVSATIAQVYVDRFDLTRDQWRILAWLGKHAEMQAKEVGRNAGLDKMQMSRALARLEEKKLVSIKPDAQDRRGNILQLTKQGRALYDEITPLVTAREDYLLAALTPDEAASLDTIIDKLRRQALTLKARG
ncbi:MarR family transcriptional regulator [Microbacteriaceae bacterium K1510]|nr:MarR family transcriptional regulator [Microbacteriaceae bacterium K1510]